MNPSIGMPRGEILIGGPCVCQGYYMVSSTFLFYHSPSFPSPPPLPQIPYYTPSQELYPCTQIRRILVDSATSSFSYSNPSQAPHMIDEDLVSKNQTEFSVINGIR